VSAPHRRRRFGSRLVALVPILAACAGDPAPAVEARRAQYTAALSGFVVRDLPGVARPQIALDVQLTGGSTPPLPGLTLDVALSSADGGERAKKRVWVETPQAGLGVTRDGAVTIRLDDLDYQPGDRFSVAVRSPIPLAERGDYRELGGRGATR
jgi:hypothetical protein